jgi:hypothetical protein
MYPGKLSLAAIITGFLIRSATLFAMSPAMPLLTSSSI